MRHRLVSAPFLALLLLSAVTMARAADVPPGDVGFDIKFDEGYPKKEVNNSTKVKTIVCKGTWEGLTAGSTRDKIEKITAGVLLTSTVKDVPLTQTLTSKEAKPADYVATNTEKTKGTWTITLNEPAFEGMPDGTLTVFAQIRPPAKDKGTATKPYPK